jgi:hypothetical protein
MKKFKNLLSLTLSFLILISAFTLVPLTASAETCGDYEYTTDDTATITKYNGSASNVTIPDELDRYKVTYIGESAFESNKSISSVTIPYGISGIDASAFFNCTSLQNVIIPNSVQRIGENAFAYCSSLTSIEIPDSVKNIGSFAFDGCVNLTSVKIGKGIKSIDEKAIGFCESDHGYLRTPNLKIYGYSGTAAESYSKENNFDFISLGDISSDPVPYPIEKNQNPITVTVEEFTFNKDINPNFEGVFYPLTVSEAVGLVHYSLVPISYEDESTALPATDYVVLNEYNGELVVKPNIPSGYYRIKIKVTADGNSNYKSKTIAKTVYFNVTGSNTNLSSSASSDSKVNAKKENPVKVTAKTKTLKAKKLKKKAQKINAISVKDNQGKVTFKLVKSGITKKVRKLCKINSKGVIKLKKWKKAKKGIYKIKVKVTAAGNASYNAKTITKTVKVKVK